ncbi:MAG TPA: hypothetical protein VIK97_01105, partial [Casimicrobiaceae bacterium]
MRRLPEVDGSARRQHVSPAVAPAAGHFGARRKKRRHEAGVSKGMYVDYCACAISTRIVFIALLSIWRIRSADT